MKIDILKLLNIIIFLICILTFGIYGVIKEKADFSEIENRELAKAPSFSVKSYANGSYTKDMEKYINDHFPMRDEFISLSRDINAVVDVHEIASYQSNDTDITVFNEADYESFVSLGSFCIFNSMIYEKYVFNEEKCQDYTNAINILYKESGSIPTYVMMAPTQYELYIPKNHQEHSVNNDEITAYINSLLNGSEYIDLYSIYEDHLNENIFFKTDHHWTQTGAYYAYSEFIKTIGEAPISIDKFTKGSSNGFLGSLYKSIYDKPQSKQFENSPEEIPYYLPIMDVDVFNHSTSDMTDTEIRKLIYPNNNDYSVYMGGDISLGYIKTGNKNGKSIMVVRDSYGHAFIPFLIYHFDELYFVEPRYFENVKFNLGLFVQEKDIDMLLFLNYKMPAVSDYWMEWAEELNRLH